MRVKGIGKGGFNALDFVIVIILAFLVLSAFFKINNRRISLVFDKAEDATVTVSIVDENVNEEMYEIGQKIYLHPSKDVLGTVTQVRNIKEKKYSQINHSLVYNYTDKNIGVQLEIETKIKQSNSKKYVCGTYFIATGADFEVYTKKTSVFSCTVDDILIKE